VDPKVTHPDKNAGRVTCPAGTVLATRISLFVALLSVLASLGCCPRQHSQELGFEISFPASLHQQPITGRLFVTITRSSKSEPRLQIGDVPVFAVGVEQLAPGAAVRIDANTLGYPVRTLRDISDGDYYVQALLNVYTEFHRADGRVLWLHMDQWEGQDLARSPGNLISEVKHVHLDPKSGYHEKFLVTKVIPPIEVPVDTSWVRRVKFQSKLLSRSGAAQFTSELLSFCHEDTASTQTRFIQ
jgi:hypothetical protein